MLPRVYLETSVISYLAARPSRDLITAGRQQLTHQWWRLRRNQVEVFVSQLVWDEAMAGDAEAAERRSHYLAGLPLVATTPEATALATTLMRAVRLPLRAEPDALHIAIAATHGLGYLLTWNSAHIANAERRPLVERACLGAGFSPPILCTPDELMGAES